MEEADWGAAPREVDVAAGARGGGRRDAEEGGSGCREAAERGGGSAEGGAERRRGSGGAWPSRW
jgi:hypothetical protein